MKYEKNIEVLERLTAEHAFIIPIEKHRNQDGSINT